MKKFTLAVHSLGNIGTRVVEAALAAPDCQCLGVIRRAESLGSFQAGQIGKFGQATQGMALRAQGFGTADHAEALAIIQA